ncbi:MAG: DUF4124 domain-containing protein [Gallionella sp.]|nr:DUF4124 domain-containing protein [Gallionella sp.]MDP1941521.1 DUF4124 domain-containing protein [Gallionella sp.]
MTKSKLLIALITGATFCSPVSAKMYKWVDDQGTTHYGQTLPPEYAGKDRQILNKSGVIIKTQEVLTPEERRAKESEVNKIRTDEEEARDRRRYDKSLTDTYSSVDEIELSRSRNLQQVDARINSINSQLKIANNNLLGFQRDVDNLNKSGGNIPASLRDDLKEAQERVQHLQQDLDKYKAEKQAVQARYDADKTRYKELTGK